MAKSQITQLATKDYHIYKAQWENVCSIWWLGLARYSHITNIYFDIILNKWNMRRTACKKSKHYLVLKSTFYSNRLFFSFCAAI